MLADFVLCISAWLIVGQSSPIRLAERIPEPSSPPSLKPRCTAPDSTSFYRLVLATCFMSCILSPHSLSISLWKGHFADSPPPFSLAPLPIRPPRAPYVIFLHVRLWSSVPRQQRWVFSVSSDGKIVSAVFTQRPPVLTELVWFDDVPFGITGAHIRFEFQLMRYIISINAATVISHRVGS